MDFRYQPDLGTPYAMAPTKMIKCKFFAQGFCKYGDACNFLHGWQTHNTALSTTQRPRIRPSAPTLKSEDVRSSRICTLFMQGSCQKGNKCRDRHPQATAQSPQVDMNATSFDSCRGQEDNSTPPSQSDSRAQVPCRFFSLPGGCRNESCPYLHILGNHEGNRSRDCEEKDEASKFP